MRSERPAAISPLRLACPAAKAGALASAKAAPVTARKSRRPRRSGRECCSRIELSPLRCRSWRHEAGLPPLGSAVDRGALRVCHPEACCQARAGLSSSPRDPSSAVLSHPPIVVSAPLIVVSSLEKTYATRGRTQVHALAGISVEIGAGEFITIVGQSGCGKTTLLRSWQACSRARREASPCAAGS